MNDYRFGNFLRNLRTNRRLSQQQLGNMVGVSNKAVSKWETGTAKPQMGTCYKLAAAFGISVDELLACRLQSAIAGKGIFSMKQELWNKAKKNLYRCYGACPPIEALGRFASEKAAFEGSNIIVFWDFLGQLSQKAQQQQGILRPRGEMGASFVAWLMGASMCNPLPPHYYCPNCGRSEFHQEAQDGWDLPRKACVCSHEMRRDGHRIPMEHYAQAAKQRFSFECDVPEAFEPSIRAFLYEYFRDSARVYQVDITDYTDISYTRYLLLPDTVDAPQAADGILHMSAQAFWERYKNETSFSFLSSPVLSELHRLEQHTNWSPYQVNFLSGEVLSALIHNTLPAWLEPQVSPLRSFFQQLPPKCFSELLTLSGLAHSSGVWELNGQSLLESGTVSLHELIAFREDVFDEILSHMPMGTGTGFPMQIMRQAAMGRFHRNSMDEATAYALHSLGIPEWYIDSLKQVLYLFSKSHSVLSEQLTLISVWYVLHYPDLCNGR